MAISDSGRNTHTDGHGQKPYYPAEKTPYGEPTEPRADDVPFVPGGSFERPGRLDLGEQDTRLPWLEGDDDFEEPHSGMGQGALLALLGVLAIAVLLGGLFWVTRKQPDTALVADGGVIAAPKEPYKVRPENPGGEVVAGTGDTSFAVAEGQRRQTNIGGEEMSAAPGIDSAGTPGPTASALDTPKAPAAAPLHGVGVQVGAYASKDLAEAGWNTLKTQYSELAGVNHRVVQGQADIGTVYRLQAVTGDAASARALCAGMKGAGLSCQVKN
ncbi:hypothetical protein WSK_2431 [Novosphingobium sp. Rr 2-17]|uniref:SPOR domain-containing protein n=1 Tax=Novosphingobium sp. Rr 2-17 TaxID=555793 RepID=UPI000269A82B|nr:SPOR domain-containing protein [Novosphingobium sp. Rr 2-17]EIZ78888.1 hypothetical protein WSK_2431 [Novosphingobium sp. Rr 2-17]